METNFKTLHFGQYLRSTMVSILDILDVFLRLKPSSALILTELQHFETGFKWGRGVHSFEVMGLPSVSLGGLAIAPGIRGFRLVGSSMGTVFWYLR
jgi:hypothetical protein